MKFCSYINEEYDDKVYLEIKDILLKNNTKPFLKEFGKTYVRGKFIWRGNRFISSPGYLLKKARTDRRPRFIHQDLHKRLSALSKKLFGWDIRTQGVFTADGHTASRFGSEAIFIPFGNYKYVYNDTSFEEIYRIYDMYGAYDKKTEKKRLEDLDKMYAKDYKTKGLTSTLKQEKKFEAIFKCDEYMLVLHYKIRTIIFEVMKEYNLV